MCPHIDQLDGTKQRSLRNRGNAIYIRKGNEGDYTDRGGPFDKYI